MSHLQPCGVLGRVIKVVHLVILGTVACNMLWKITPLAPHLRKTAATSDDDGDRTAREKQCMVELCARQCLEGPRTQTLQLDFADACSAQLVPN